MVSRTNFPIFLDQVFVKGALLKLLVPFEEQKIRLGFKPFLCRCKKLFHWSIPMRSFQQIWMKLLDLFEEICRHLRRLRSKYEVDRTRMHEAILFQLHPQEHLTNLTKGFDRIMQNPCPLQTKIRQFS